MNIVLWIVQVILAAFFLTAGSIKLVLDKKKLEQVFEWLQDISQQRLQLIGWLEILGGLGLFLPGVYSTLLILIPISAFGLTIIMILAALMHFKRHEKREFILNIVVSIFLLIVIIGRIIF
ncbi:MAG TPA: DoxX family protein [Draconibacterium sp.]|nr:DoxX family protein [Draconibacterium sp.]